MLSPFETIQLHRRSFENTTKYLPTDSVGTKVEYMASSCNVLEICVRTSAEDMEPICTKLLHQVLQVLHKKPSVNFVRLRMLTFFPHTAQTSLLLPNDILIPLSIMGTKSAYHPNKSCLYPGAHWPRTRPTVRSSSNSPTMMSSYFGFRETSRIC